jgi:hypothetical protein
MKIPKDNIMKIVQVLGVTATVWLSLAEDQFLNTHHNNVLLKSNLSENEIVTMDGLIRKSVYTRVKHPSKGIAYKRNTQIDESKLCVGPNLLTEASKYDSADDFGETELDILIRAQRMGVPGDIALAVAQQESNMRHFNKDGEVIQGKNPGETHHAQGMFQLRRAAVTDVKRKKLVPDTHDVSKQGDNIDLGLGYLKHMADRSGGDWHEAVRKYFDGPSKTTKAGLKYQKEVLGRQSAFEPIVQQVKLPNANDNKVAQADPVRATNTGAEEPDQGPEWMTKPPWNIPTPNDPDGDPRNKQVSADNPDSATSDDLAANTIRRKRDVPDATIVDKITKTLIPDASANSEIPDNIPTPISPSQDELEQLKDLRRGMNKGGPTAIDKELDNKNKNIANTLNQLDKISNKSKIGNTKGAESPKTPQKDPGFEPTITIPDTKRQVRSVNAQQANKASDKMDLAKIRKHTVPSPGTKLAPPAPNFGGKNSGPQSTKFNAPKDLSTRMQPAKGVDLKGAFKKAVDKVKNNTAKPVDVNARRNK